MEVSKINSSMSQVQNFKGSEQETKSAPKEEKGGKKKLALALGALAIAGAAAVAIYKTSKGQGVKLADITFEKGIASLKEGGEKFTGVIKDTLKNGDKVVLEYTDGVIQKSTREGSKNLQKIFSKAENGNRLVTIIEDGKERIVNPVITKLTSVFGRFLNEEEIKALSNLDQKIVDKEIKTLGGLLKKNNDNIKSPAVQELIRELRESLSRKIKN